MSQLELRYEETIQSARGRQHRNRIVNKQIDFLFAHRVVGAIVEAFACTQASQPRASQERSKSGQKHPPYAKNPQKARQEARISQRHKYNEAQQKPNTPVERG